MMVLSHKHNVIFGQIILILVGKIGYDLLIGMNVIKVDKLHLLLFESKKWFIFL